MKNVQSKPGIIVTQAGPTRFTSTLYCLARKGFAIQVPKSKDPSQRVQEAIALLIHDEEAKRKAEEFSRVIEHWDGPRMAAELLNDKFAD